MRSSIRVIRFAAIMSFLSFIATYFIGVNMETQWIVLSSPWVSETVLLAVLGNVFTGFLVMLFCELQKYNMCKEAAETQLYSQASSLYGQLLIIQSNIQKILSDPDSILSDHLLDNPIRQAKMYLDGLKYSEYYPLHKGNELYKAHGNFQTQDAVSLDSFISDCNCFALAVNQDGINKLTLGNTEKVTSKDFLTCTTLQILLRKVPECLTCVDLFLQILDLNCGRRYRWAERRNAIGKGWDKDTYNILENFFIREVPKL